MMMTRRRKIAICLVLGVAVAGAFTELEQRTSPWFVMILAVPALLASLGIIMTLSARSAVFEPVDRLAKPYMTIKYDVMAEDEYDRQVVLDALESVGFVRAGAVWVTTEEYDSVVPLLLAGDRRTFAIVTDHLTLTSEYDGKILSTATSGVAAPKEFELRQAFPPMGVSELLAWHNQTIDRVRRSTGKSPRRLDQSMVVDVFITSESAEVNMASQVIAMLTTPFRGSRRDPLGVGSVRTIQSWLNREDDYRIA